MQDWGRTWRFERRWDLVGTRAETTCTKRELEELKRADTGKGFFTTSTISAVKDNMPALANFLEADRVENPHRFLVASISGSTDYRYSISSAYSASDR